MQTKKETNAPILERELFVKMAISVWETQTARVTKLVGSLSDDLMMSETAPGRNRGIYIVGHLTAVSDSMIPMFGWGEKLYPQLENIFIKNPDKAVEAPSASEVKKYWNEVNAKITQNINKMTSDGWFEKHSAVSAEDFVKEPHRNKLNVLISRTNHTSYHLGQLIYLVKK